MLNAQTKQRMNNARDVLVGKVPDPKGQIEQITLALMYRYMDHMDRLSEEMGGAARFFTNGYERFAWGKLMDTRLGGQDRLNLYAEAIEKMSANPHLPQLFRDIFRGAFLPYRDPETLRLFLKEISAFCLDHTEDLGDGFEFLLSVMSAQGDAGQFRTPRHIIKFIVDAVDPRKGDSILDPACGTAGFLIHAYQHILEANTAVRPGDALTSDEREALAHSLVGYDISPDMARLARVNMYLHEFVNPDIYEYDTLTSENHWDDNYDVILANPPFMTPKGGIRPHKRFSVQAKRSEVLFVDYIAEHLTPLGRAGVIVPEGIIFQSSNAYKALRKMLVEDNYLWAVVSLPAGVFQPYSGVKTSVLLMDRELAKRSDDILFVKVENDGFDLGAQRREIEKNDLPDALEALLAHKTTAMSGHPELVEGAASPQVLPVPKSRIAASGDYNLSGERYRENGARLSTFPTAPLGELCDLIGGATPSKQNEGYWTHGSVKWISSKHIDDRGHITAFELISKAAIEETSTRVAPKGSTIIITRVSVGKYAFADDNYAINQDLTALVSKDDQRLAPAFLHVAAHHIAQEVERSAEGIGVRGVTRSFLSALQIPLPPLEVQQQIVEEIEGYQKVIDGARAVLDNYRPHIPIHPDWPMVELGEVTEMGGTITTSIDGNLPSFGADSIESNTGKLLKQESAEAQGVRGPVYEFDGERLLYSKIRPYLNKLTVVYLRGYCSSDMYPLAVDARKADIRFLATYMLSSAFNEVIRGFYERASIPKINQTQLFGTRIPLPPLDTQRAIVAEIEAVQALVNSNRDLIARMEARIKAKIDEVWGE